MTLGYKQRLSGWYDPIQRQQTGPCWISPRLSAALGNQNAKVAPYVSDAVTIFQDSAMQSLLLCRSVANRPPKLCRSILALQSIVRFGFNRKTSTHWLPATAATTRRVWIGHLFCLFCTPEPQFGLFLWTGSQNHTFASTASEFTSRILAFARQASQRLSFLPLLPRIS